MASNTEFSPLRLVNDAVNNANTAGQTLTPEAIGLLWKLAQGNLSEHDASELSRTLRGAMLKRREPCEFQIVGADAAVAFEALASSLAEIHRQLVGVGSPRCDIASFTDPAT